MVLWTLLSLSSFDLLLKSSRQRIQHFPAAGHRWAPWRFELTWSGIVATVSEYIRTEQSPVRFSHCGGHWLSASREAVEAVVGVHRLARDLQQQAALYS